MSPRVSGALPHNLQVLGSKAGFEMGSCAILADMQEKQALFTGTFDPFHVGHVWQLQRAHAVTPYETVVVAVIRANPKKPQAIAWQHRVALAERTLRSLDLPFAWKVLSIENVSEASLKAFVGQQLAETRMPLRVIGSDSLIEFAQDKTMRPVLQLFGYTVTLRPETNPVDVDQAITHIKSTGYAAFDPTVVLLGPDYAHVADISARNLRTNVAASSRAGLLPVEALAYMRAHKLYSFANGSKG
jgi:cytidyltransferase-like protein